MGPITGSVAGPEHFHQHGVIMEAAVFNNYGSMEYEKTEPQKKYA